MTHPLHPTRRHTLALLGTFGTIGAAGLAGCGASLLPKPPAAPALYGLDDGAAMPPARPPAPAGAPSLLVTVPRAAAGLDSRLMAYQRSPQRIEHYTASEWLDAPPRLMAPLLVRAAEATGAFRVVLQAPAGAAAEQVFAATDGSVGMVKSGCAKSKADIRSPTTSRTRFSAASCSARTSSIDSTGALCKKKTTRETRARQQPTDEFSVCAREAPQQSTTARGRV